MNTARRIAFTSLTLVSLVGCASAPSAAGRPATQPAAAMQSATAPRPRRNLITEAEIANSQSPMENAFLLIQRLRPAMLGARAGAVDATSGDGMVVNQMGLAVYFDNQPLGGVDALRNVMVNQIREIRLLSASDATTLFGTNNSGGAIQVISKR